MNRVSVLAGILAATWAGLVAAQNGGTAKPAAPAPAAARPRPAPIVASPAATPAANTGNQAATRALLDQYCVTCHNARVKTANLLLDQLDLARLGDHVDVAETLVRKVRAGLMPPPSAKRPERAALQAMITWMEGELDRSADTHLPPPGLHRLNRTEYTNAIRDLLALEVDASKFLPADDSTRGFDNIAGALTMSSAGRNLLASTSSASRSRMAFVYSVRFNR